MRNLPLTLVLAGAVFTAACSDTTGPRAARQQNPRSGRLEAEAIQFSGLVASVDLGTSTFVVNDAILGPTTVHVGIAPNPAGDLTSLSAVAAQPTNSVRAEGAGTLGASVIEASKVKFQIDEPEP